MACPDDGCRLAIDELTERLPITGNDRVHDGAVTADSQLVAGCRRLDGCSRLENCAAPLDSSLGGQDDRGAVEP
jgi:hypothetical protein